MPAVWEDARVARGRRRQLAALDALLDGGARFLGWKLGLGAPAAMQRAGTDAPLVGFLTSATLLPDDATVSLGGWQHPVLEPEIAVHLVGDVPAGADRGTIARAVGALGPAIELADIDLPLEEVEDVVAGDLFHRHVVLGDTDPAGAGGDAGGLRVHVSNHGERIAAADDPTELTGDLLDLVGHVAGWLHAAGRRLEAGHVVIAGSTVPLIEVSPGDHIEYHCEPRGQLAVHLTR